jgi:hypothetical protein
MEIDGIEWAVDHCLVSREPDLPPAMAQAEKALSSRLQVITDAHKCGLAVSYLPEARSGHSRQEIEDYCNEVTATAEAAAKSQEMSVGTDGFITVQVTSLPACPARSAARGSCPASAAASAARASRRPRAAGSGDNAAARS